MQVADGLGAQVVVEPMEISAGRFAALADGQGAVFYLMEMTDL
jgi:predicted enzyme related to lactoylglutathione lyase